MFRVKICGITSWRDARLALEAGADALGFNFYPLSPRYLEPVAAARIIRRLPRGAAAVGVFVDTPTEQILHIVQTSGVTLVQLHGRENPAQVAALARHCPVIKAFRVRNGFRTARLLNFPAATAFLLDGFSRKLPGGTGTRFDWRIAARARRYGAIILSGGLTPENVAAAIAQVHPAAVDVCSGVEASPGKKDPARLRALLREIETVRKEFA
ncbi:MAG: phosphoribosylanthranilate isomerase [Acidobacteriia bacterium]|jgi:phosphoribosylanthranilate isomerase|nr:phosphoribosylanthranilate isomerase [Terriglobia bacterium]